MWSAIDDGDVAVVVEDDDDDDDDNAGDDGDDYDKDVVLGGSGRVGRVE